MASTAVTALVLEVWLSVSFSRCGRTPGADSFNLATLDRGGGKQEN
jgi:hypothetical protein